MLPSNAPFKLGQHVRILVAVGDFDGNTGRVIDYVINALYHIIAVVKFDSGLTGSACFYPNELVEIE